jgi:sugar phosphate isomerase/epimerase
VNLAIEPQTTFMMPPDLFVHLAADLGCGSVGIMLASHGWNPEGWEPWSLRNDPKLRKRFADALDERAVSISLGDGFQILPGKNARDAEADLDLVRELGATTVNTGSFEPDLARAHEQFAQLVELAADRGMVTTLEFAPPHTIGNLTLALDAVRAVGRTDHFKLLIDTMHFVRSGSSIAGLAALDPRMIGYSHLSDNSIEPRNPTYREDSQDRMPPGEGELPLRELVALIPEDVTISVEVPMRSRAEAGISTRDRVRIAVDASRRLVESVRHSSGTEPLDIMEHHFKEIEE